MTIPLHSLQTKIQRLKHNWMKKAIPFQQILVCVSVYVRKNKTNHIERSHIDVATKKTDNYTTMFVV